MACGPGWRVPASMTSHGTFTAKEGSTSCPAETLSQDAIAQGVQQLHTDCGSAIAPLRPCRAKAHLDPARSVEPQMSSTRRSSAKPTRQVLPSPASIVAVRSLIRTTVPTTVCRYEVAPENRSA